VAGNYSIITDNDFSEFTSTGSKIITGIDCIVDRNVGYHYTTQLYFPTSAPSSPQDGDAYFDTSTNTLYIYNGTAWVSVTLT